MCKFECLARFICDVTSLCTPGRNVPPCHICDTHLWHRPRQPERKDTLWRSGQAARTCSIRPRPYRRPRLAQSFPRPSWLSRPGNGLLRPATNPAPPVQPPPRFPVVPLRASNPKVNSKGVKSTSFRSAYGWKDIRINLTALSQRLMLVPVLPARPVRPIRCT